MQKGWTSATLLALCLSGAAFAEGKVAVDVYKSGERVEVRLNGSAPLQGVTQSWKENPHRLQVFVPNVDTKAVSSTIDRGVLQKIQARPNGGGLLLEVFANANPKMQWRSSGDKKTWTLHISSTDMADGNAPPSLPGAPAVASRPAVSRPPARPAAAPVAAQPPAPPRHSPDAPANRPPQASPAPAASPSRPSAPAPAAPAPAAPRPVAPTAVRPAAPAPAAPAPPAARPPAPAPAAPAPVASRPPAAAPVPAARPPAPPAPAASPAPRPAAAPAAQRPEQRLISVNLQNQDLPSAIRAIAKAAGMEADIGPGVQGANATVSFTEVPLGQALTSILGKQTRLIEYKIENNRLRVFTDDNDAGATLTTGPAVARLSDYFPIAAEKPAGEMLEALRRAVQGIEVTADDRLNVLFVRGSAQDLEKVRNLLRNVLAK